VREQRFEITSVLRASPPEVWDRVASAEGINHELMPLLRMTVPKDARTIDAGTIPIGEKAFRSWVFLLGVIPFDYDDLTLVRLDPGKGFLEQSTMLTQRFWEHERTLEPVAEGTRVTDRLRFEPRLPPRRLQRAFVARIFRHRHRRLRRYFGGKPIPDPR
jgi:ligand-binding SRPBCC domain-containing protein